MKCKIFLILILPILICSGCGKSDNTTNTETTKNTSMYILQSETEGFTTEDDSFPDNEDFEEVERTPVNPAEVKVIPVDSKNSNTEKCVQEDLNSSGGRSYTICGGWDKAYKGGKFDVDFEISSYNEKPVSLGLYMNVSGIYIPFSVRQYSDNTFNTPKSEESSNDVYHNLWIEAKDENTYFFKAAFSLDMFPKGSVVFPHLIYNTNDKYLPDLDGKVSSMATAVNGIYPPRVTIKVDNKESLPKVDTTYTTEPMPSDYYDENDMGMPKFTVACENGGTLSKISKADTLKYTITGHTANYKLEDKYSNQKVRLSVLVNNKPYPAFNGKYYLDMEMNDSTYYHSSFTVNGKDLVGVNKVQVMYCHFPIEKYDFDGFYDTEPLYIQVN